MKELIELQKKLMVGKDQSGANGKYKYRKVDDILRAVRDSGIENIYIILTDELVELAGCVYTKGTATLYCGDKHASASSYAKEGKLPGQSEPQISGSCSTYARKKALEGLLALDDGNDPDGNPLPQNYTDNRPAAQEKAPVKNNPATGKQKGYLRDYLKKFTELSDVKAIDYISDALNNEYLTEEKAEEIIRKAKAAFNE